MAATAAIQRNGTLTFGATGAGQLVASCRPSAVLLNPTASDVGDTVEVLCGDSINPETQIAWTLDVTAFQDWDQAVTDSLQQWALANAGTDQPYEWKPNAAGTFKGTVTVQPIPIGGAVGTKATVDFSWKCTGAPTWTAATPPEAPAAAPATTTTAKTAETV